MSWVIWRTQARPAHDRQAWQQKMLGHLKQKLGLTDDQVTQIRQVHFFTDSSLYGLSRWGRVEDRLRS